MLICQEMFLLLTKDNGKQEDWVSNNEAALRATVPVSYTHLTLPTKRIV